MVIDKTQFLGCLSKSIEIFEQRLGEKDPMALSTLLAIKVARFQKESASVQKSLVQPYITKELPDPNTQKSPGTKKKEKEPTELQKLWDECVPCWDRLKTSGDLKLTPATADLTRDSIARMLSLKELLSKIVDYRESAYLNSICSYFDALKHQCVPDIERLIAIFSILIRQLTESLLVDIGANLGSLVVALYRPYFTRLQTNIDQLIDLLIAPLECVKTSLFYQFSKIDFAMSSKDSKIYKDKLYSSTNLNFVDATYDNAFNEAEQLLLQGITLGESFIRDIQKSTITKLQELFNINNDETVVRLELTLKFGYILQMLEVLKKLKNDLPGFCENEDNRNDALNKFLDEYNKKQVGKSKIIRKNKKIYVKKPLPNYKPSPLSQSPNTQIDFSNSQSGIEFVTEGEQVFEIRELGCLEKAKLDKANQIKDWIAKIESQEG